jgi:hypothetical protein
MPAETGREALSHEASVSMVASKTGAERKTLGMAIAFQKLSAA